MTKRVLVTLAAASLALLSCSTPPQDGPGTVGPRVEVRSQDFSRCGPLGCNGGGILPVGGSKSPQETECDQELRVCLTECASVCGVLGAGYCYICNSNCNYEYVDCLNAVGPVPRAF